MKGYKDPQGRFRPTENKKGVRKARNQSTKTVGVKFPKFDIKLPERKETYAELLENINRNATERARLITVDEDLANKILQNPTSEFNETWKEQIKQTNRIVKDINSDLKRDISKLTPAEKKQLPDEVKNLTRFL